MIGALLAAPLVLAVAASAGQTDTPAATALAALNRIRAENGIPAGVTLNADWSSKCAAHDRYEQANHLLDHPEDPSKPGYSSDGNWAGTHSVLAQGASWGPDSTPWDTAPIHFAQMLGPALAETGIANVAGYSCLTTWPGYEHTGPSDVIYTYPGNGRADVAPTETADELPFVPGQFVGISAGTTTGPYLYVLPDGPWTSTWGSQPRLTAASLTGPTGPVALQTIDNTNANLAGYLPTGSGMVIPEKPLRGNASYTATATLSGGAETLTKTWSFKTRRYDNTVSIDLEHEDDGSVWLGVRSDAPNPTLTLADGHRTRTPPLSEDYVADLAAVPLGMYQACASSGGGDSEFEPGRACVKVALVAPLRYIAVSPVRVSNRNATVTIQASPPFVGRRVIADMRSGCSNVGPCKAMLYKTVLLRKAQTFSLLVPTGESHVVFVLRIPAGRIRGVPFDQVAVCRDWRAGRTVNC